VPSWKIISQPTDSYELNHDMIDHEYLVSVIDARGRTVMAEHAYGIPHRTQITRKFISLYGSYIVKIEHQ
jgi:hypothetical protein